MKLFGFLKPKANISAQDVVAGLRWLTLDGMVSNGFNSITTSGVLAAYALALGTNNLQIGILAAIPFLMQFFQIPGIWLVEKLRHRKAIAVVSFFFAQLLWIPIALIPFIINTPGALAISLMLILMVINGLMRGITHSAWNSWVRDLVPQQILGRFFSRRLALSTVVSIIFSLGAAFFIDYWAGNSGGNRIVYGYTYVILFGAVFLAMASPVCMALMPEPRMQETQQPDIPITKKLVIPLKDINFRKLMQFLFVWSVVSNLAIPFFTVYMLQRLGLPLSWVIALSILSQILNIFFLRVWGPLVDKFGNKVILSLCSSLYLLVIFGWIFVAMPERHFLTVPLLVVLHGFAGIASAGITLTTSTIGLKMAPPNESTSYLAGASLATNLGTGLGPLAGGLLADFFGSRHLNLTFNWTDPAASFQFPLITLNGLDFLFGIAFIIGIPVLGLLATIREQGEVRKEEVLESLMTQAREFSRPISSGMSFNLLSYFPLINLKRVPLVGLDVALGVTIYQFAHMAKMASLASIHSRNIIIKMLRVLEQIFIGIWRYGQINMEMDGVAVAREAAYQAINTQGRMPLDVDSVENAVMLSVVKAVSQAGARHEDAVVGSCQGIFRAAVELHIDPSLAAYQITKVAESVATQIGLSREQAVNKASQGIITAAKELGTDVFDQVNRHLKSNKYIIKSSDYYGSNN